MCMEMDQDSVQTRALLKAKISLWLQAPCFEIIIYYLQFYHRRHKTCIRFQIVLNGHKQTNVTFYILLNVLPNIRIVYFYYQLDAQILYFNTFNIFLCMFRAPLCSFSGGQIVLVQHLVSSLSLGYCSVQRLRESKFFILIHLLYSSTCFEHYCAHIQEVKLY